jgi:hypothetical protein
VGCCGHQVWRDAGVNLNEVRASSMALQVRAQIIWGIVDLPAVFSNLHGPPSTTFPLASTRIKSEARIRGHATPNGLTQKLVGSTGSCFG